MEEPQVGLTRRSSKLRLLTFAAIKDPNKDLTLWESGAIILYLIEQYDKKGLLTCESMQDKQLLNQWLMFQMSGQGPYFGQCGW
jgi:glutathione S-transferase